MGTTNENTMCLEGRKPMLLAIVLAAVIAVALSLSAFAPKAYAGGGVYLSSIYSGTQKVSVLSGQTAAKNTAYYVTDAYKAITSAKSSNKKVATVKVVKTKPQTMYGYKMPGYYTLQVCFKGAGTTKVSYKYKGKSHAVTFKVSKYANPFKSFTIGSKNYKNDFAAKKLFKNSRGYAATLSTSSIKGKVKVTAASGWKVNKIYYYGVKNTTIKNGATVNKQFTVEMKNKSTGLVETFWLQPTFSTRSVSSSASSLQAAAI